MVLHQSPHRGRVYDLAHLEYVHREGMIILIFVTDIRLDPGTPVDIMHQTAYLSKPWPVFHHPLGILQVHERGLLMVFDQQRVFKVELAQLAQIGQLSQSKVCGCETRASWMLEPLSLSLMNKKGLIVPAGVGPRTLTTPVRSTSRVLRYAPIEVGKQQLLLFLLYSWRSLLLLLEPGLKEPRAHRPMNSCTP